MLFAIAITIDLDIEHVDITDFLNNDLNERIFMKQPGYYDDNNKVCL